MGRKRKQSPITDVKFNEVYTNEDTSSIDFEAWTNFISYYRYYMDEFAEDILGIKLYPFQKVILRALARGQNTILIACRGLGRFAD